MQTAITSLCEQTAWSAWYPLENCWLGHLLPTCSGLYRILLVEPEQTRLAYLGQSLSLKARLGKLRCVYEEICPSYDRHFAGPALWSWRQALPGSHYEVSIARFPSISKPLRLGLECLALALCQQEHGVSPLANFGRTRDEWQALRSSPQDCWEEEVAPTGPLDGNPHDIRWCGLDWTPWVPLQHAHVPGGGQGLYRLRVGGCDPLLYIGQGKVAPRLKGYRSPLPLECSWVTGNWTYHRRLELRSNAIGAHLLALSVVPLWQFEGETPLGGPANMSPAA